MASPLHCVPVGSIRADRLRRNELGYLERVDAEYRPDLRIHFWTRFPPARFPSLDGSRPNAQAAGDLNDRQPLGEPVPPQQCHELASVLSGGRLDGLIPSVRVNLTSTSDNCKNNVEKKTANARKF
jgi:hypothetical protein